MRQGNCKLASGFTLIELLVVIFIVLMVSVLAIATIMPALASHNITGGAQAIQAALVQARDRSANTGSLCGVRFTLDPSFPPTYQSNGQIDPTSTLASNAWVFLETPGDYSEGLCNIFPGPSPLTLPSAVLVLEQSRTQAPNQITTPTNWWWNIRVGERVTIGGGREYTIVGPVVDGNGEGFVNIGPPGTVSKLDRGEGPVEYLYLVNGLDDNGDGMADNGYEPVTANPLSTFAKFETETWQGKLAQGIQRAHYAIHRRPVPVTGATSNTLPSGMVVDLTGWSTTKDRSRLPVDPYTGSVDILVDATGKTTLGTIYSVPTASTLGSQWSFFWICPRSDVGLPPKGDARLVGLNGTTGRVSVLDPASSANPHLDLMQGQR